MVSGSFNYDHSGRVRNGGIAEDEKTQGSWLLPDAGANYGVMRGFDVETKKIFGKILSQARNSFDKLLGVPGINKIAAEVGAGHDQSRLEQCNKETQGLGIEIERLDLQIKAQNKIIARMEADIDKQANGLAGIGTLIKRNTIEVRKNKTAALEEKRKKLVAKVAVSEAAAQVCARQRDGYIDWLDNHYSEKISPLENERNMWESKLESFNKDNESLEEDFAGWAAEIPELENQKAEIVKDLAASGVPLRQIEEDISYYDEQIKYRKKSLMDWNDIKLGRAKLEQRIAVINEKIVRMDIRNEFTAAKNIRPLILTSHKPLTPVPVPKRNVGGRKFESRESTVRLEDNIIEWNNFLLGKFGANLKEEMTVYPQELMRLENISGDDLVNMEEFKDLLGDFYKKKISGDENMSLVIGQAIGDFLDTKGGGKQIIPDIDAQDELVDENSEPSGEYGEVAGKDYVEDKYENIEDKIGIGKVLGKWNKYIRKNFNKGFKFEPIVKLPDLLREIENQANKDMAVQEGQPLNPEKFKYIIGRFYNIKFPQSDALYEELGRLMEDFIKDKDNFAGIEMSAVSVPKPMADRRSVEEASSGIETGAGENAELPKLKLNEITAKWYQFIKDEFKNDLAVVISPADLAQKEHAPENISIEEFVEIISRSYENNYRIKEDAKQRLKQLIVRFQKENTLTK